MEAMLEGLEALDPSDKIALLPVLQTGSPRALACAWEAHHMRRKDAPDCLYGRMADMILALKPGQQADPCWLQGGRAWAFGLAHRDRKGARWGYNLEGGQYEALSVSLDGEVSSLGADLRRGLGMGLSSPHVRAALRALIRADRHSFGWVSARIARRGDPASIYLDRLIQENS